MFTRKRKSRVLSLILCAVIAWAFALPAMASNQNALVQRFSKLFPGTKFVPRDGNNRFYLVYNFSSAPIKGDIVLKSRDFLESHAALFGLDNPSSNIRFDKIVPFRRNKYIHFNQYIEGLPVFERNVIVHVDSKNRIIKINSTAESASPREYAPILDAGQAYEFATADIADAADRGPVVLGYYPVQEMPVLAYQVISMAKGPHLWVTYVNALTGSILMRYDQIKRHKAMLYAQNPTVTKDLVEVELENIDLEGDHALHTYGSYAKVASCSQMSQYGGCTNWRFDAVANPENGFLDIAPVLSKNPTTADGFSELMVYNAVDKQNRWYRETFNFQGQWYDSEKQALSNEMALADSIWIYVNVDYENGFFSGGSNYPGYESAASIVLGHIGGADLAYDNDVVLHEFGHAVSSIAFKFGMGNLDELGIDMSAGGLEEGQADYFAATTYGSPEIGEYAGVERVLENNNTCPDSLMGESHYDGQIIAGAMWDIREELGKEKTDQLVYGALAGNNMVTFDDFGKAIIAQAEWMANRDSSLEENLRLAETDLDSVKEIVDLRAIIGCKRIVPVRENRPPLFHIMQFGFGEKGTPSAVQYKVSTGADTTYINFFISPMGDPMYDVLVREGEPIYFTWEGNSYMDISWEAEYDARWDYNVEEDIAVQDVELSTITDLKLKPNTDYYFSIICKTNYMSMLGGCQNLLSLHTSSDPIEDPNKEQETDTDVDRGEDTEVIQDTDDEEADSGVDSGNEDDDDGNGDCDCRIGGHSKDNINLFKLLNQLYI